MSTLYLMCGLPFSGKTTLAKKIVELKKYSCIGLDEMMEKRGFALSEKIPVDEWESVHQECFELLRNFMRQKENIVLDDTNYLRKLRNRFRKIADSLNYKVVTIYLNIPNTILEERRKNALETNERNYLSDDLFYEMKNNFEIPGKDENIIVYDTIDEMSDWIEKNV